MSEIEKYPKLQAILEGRVSGYTSEWPAIKSELRTLLSELEKVQVALDITSGTLEGAKGRIVELEKGLEKERERVKELENNHEIDIKDTRTLKRLLDEAESDLSTLK